MQDGGTDLKYVAQDGTATSLDFPQAVTGINALRDSLGGTSGTGASVEQPLTRTPTTVGTYTPTDDGPELFAADKNAVAFSRTPTQVSRLASLSVNHTLAKFTVGIVRQHHAVVWHV